MLLKKTQTTFSMSSKADESIMINILKTDQRQKDNWNRLVISITTLYQTEILCHSAITTTKWSFFIILSTWNKTKQSSLSLINCRIHCISLIIYTDYFLWTHPTCTWREDKWLLEKERLYHNHIPQNWGLLVLQHFKQNCKA